MRSDDEAENREIGVKNLKLLVIGSNGFKSFSISTGNLAAS